MPLVFRPLEFLLREPSFAVALTLEEPIKTQFTKFIVAFAFLAALPLVISCTATPTVAPPTNAPIVNATSTVPPPSVAASETSAPLTATPNSLGINLVAQYDPTSQVLTIFGITPGATVILAGTPLVIPTPTFTNTPAPTDTPPPTPTLAPTVFRPQPTRVPPTAPVVISAAALSGKILFKSSRDGGGFPNAFNYYVMNADGANAQRLDFNAANGLYTQLQGREGYSPDGSRVVLGERRCFGGGTCALYILDTQLDARLINSNDDISHGTWFLQRGVSAKDPVWSPASDWIAFVSNHQAKSTQCLQSTPNLFKGTPNQNPTIRLMTPFCSGGNVGHPSFNPGGDKLVFWSEDSGIKQIYILDANAEDWRTSNAHILSPSQFDDWDPLWVK